MKSLFLSFLLSLTLHAAEDWKAAFAKIPVPVRSFRAHLTEPVSLILTNFQPTTEIRAVVLMPGAADHIYFLDHGQVDLPENPTLLDAIEGLKRQASLRVTAVPPFLLIHRDIDTISDPITLGPKTSLEKVEQRKLPRRTYYLDRPYDRLVPMAEKATRFKITPTRKSPASWHYYRLSFVGYDLNGAELVRALAYGTKTGVRIDGRKAHFAER